jgi:hypothetical protein
VKSWLIYLKERFPLPVYFLLSGGLAVSGSVLVGRPAWSIPTGYAFLYAMWLFATLRLMDELKDFDKDVIAHPTRPLPRGVLNVVVVEKVIHGSMGVGIVLSLGFFAFDKLAAALALVTTAWLWLMYKEFYLGKALSKRPLLYAITHQIILIPFCLALSVAPMEDGAINYFVFWWAIGVLGSFFTYEVSRKLDPKAHPVLGTYLTVYGKLGSLAIVCALFILCLVSGVNVMLPYWTVPWAVLTLLSYGLLWLQTSEKPGKYHKVVEGFATLSLFFYIWSPALFNLYAKLVEL